MYIHIITNVHITTIATVCMYVYTYPTTYKHSLKGDEEQQMGSMMKQMGSLMRHMGPAYSSLADKMQAQLKG